MAAILGSDFGSPAPAGAGSRQTTFKNQLNAQKEREEGEEGKEGKEGEANGRNRIP